MTTHSNFSHLNLEYYRKQAKKLLKAANAGDADALARLAVVSGSGVRAEDYKLHDAQLAIAREEGFASWPKFQALLTRVYPQLPGDGEGFCRCGHFGLAACDENARGTSGIGESWNLG